MPVRYFITLVAYAATLLSLGVTSAQLAPEGANATTAIAFPAIFAALVLVFAVLSMLIRSNYRLGMIGIHGALVLPLIIALGALMRFPVSTANTQEYLEINAEVQTILDQPVGDDADEGEASQPAAVVSRTEEDNITVGQRGVTNFRTFERDDWKKSMRPVGYQAVSLFATGAVSIFAFVALLAQRPKVSKPKPAAAEDRNDE
jgi:hypothetical protein